MRVKSVILGLAGLLLPLSTATMASAQQFDASTDFRGYVQRTCGQLAGAGSAQRTGTQEDLFRRCNGALNAPAASGTGLTSQGDILDQYLGVQNITPQSDGLNRTNRADQLVASRLSVISNQLRSGLQANRPVLLASADDSFPVSDGMSRKGRWDGFFNVGGFNTEQDTSANEVGYETDGFWVAGGADYAVNNRLILGAAVSYVDSSSDIEGIGGLASGGDVDTTSWSISSFGSYMLSDTLEVNGLVSFGSSEFDMSRRISVVDKNGGGINSVADGNFATVDRTATSETDADRFEISVGVSNAYYWDNGTSVTPFANLSYYNSKADAFTETASDGLDLNVDEQEVNSTLATIGASIARPYSQSWGVLVPYASASASFELQDNEQAITARYAAALDANDNFVIRSNPSDDSVFDIAFGTTAQFSNGVTAFAEASTIVGHDDFDHVGITFGLRKEF